MQTYLFLNNLFTFIFKVDLVRYGREGGMGMESGRRGREGKGGEGPSEDRVPSLPQPSLFARATSLSLRSGPSLPSTLRPEAWVPSIHPSLPRSCRKKRYSRWLSRTLFFLFLVISISGLLVGRLHLIYYGSTSV